MRRGGRKSGRDPSNQGQAVNGLHLEIRGLQAGYGSRVVIEEVTLAVEAGDWFVLMGPNGCGKSTLLDCVVGRLAPAAGAIRIAGYSLLEDAANAKRRLGYACPPEILPGLLAARAGLGGQAVEKGLSSVGEELLELADELRFLPYLESFVDTLSLGTRQKRSVLLCLICVPKPV